MGSYWAVARTEQNREAVAVNFLNRAGYATYLPRIREQRVSHGRRITITPPLFSAYAFVRIERGWWDARWCIGVAALIKGAGNEPAKIADSMVDEIRSRERNGYVELPEPPRLKPGHPVKVVGGLFPGATGLYSGMRSADRVAVLLAVLACVTMPAADIEAAVAGPHGARRPSIARR
jgi:hypothetical protein